MRGASHPFPRLTLKPLWHGVTTHRRGYPAPPTHFSSATVYFFLRFFFIIFVFCSVSNAELIDRILAIVNDEVITQRDVDEYLAPLYFQYQTEYQGKELQQKIVSLQKNGLNQMIEERLLLSEAKKRKLPADSKQVQVRLDQVKQRFESEQEFYDTVEKQGLTVEALKDRYRDQLMINELVDQEVRYRVTVSPTETAQYYQEHLDQFQVPEKVHLENILIRAENESQEEEAFIHAQEILGLLQNSHSFEELAKKYSQGPHKEEGGDMGLVARGDLAPELEQAVFALGPQQISGIIKSPLGYHLFKVIEKVAPQIKTLSEAQQEIQEKLYREKMQARYKEFLGELRAKAYVSVK